MRNFVGDALPSGAFQITGSQVVAYSRLSKCYLVRVIVWRPDSVRLRPPTRYPLIVARPLLSLHQFRNPVAPFIGLFLAIDYCSIVS